jgi:hypothetical protein
MAISAEEDDYSVAKFYTNLWLNAAIGAAVFLTFCVFRRFGPFGLRRYEHDREACLHL